MVESTERSSINLDKMKNLFLRRYTAIGAVAALALVAIFAVAAPIALALAPTAPQVQVRDWSQVLVLFSKIFNILFWILILLAVLFIVWAAFNYLTAGGDPEKVKSANHKIIYAVVAIVVALLARAIPTLVCSFLGASGSCTTF